MKARIISSKWLGKLQIQIYHRENSAASTFPRWGMMGLPSDACSVRVHLIYVGCKILPIVDLQQKVSHGNDIA